MKTQTQDVPLLTSTQVYYFILFIYASKFMSLQIKKPLSAQAVGTHMYKDGGVNQMKPATKQPEWSTKSLAHYRETEKNDLQRPKCPTSHNAWIWNTRWSVEGHGLTSSAVRSVAHFMMDKRHRGSDLPLWFRAVGTRQTSSQRVGTQTSCHWNSCSIAPTRSGFWSRARDPGMVQPRSASRPRGRRIRTCHHTRSSLHVG